MEMTVNEIINLHFFYQDNYIKCIERPLRVLDNLYSDMSICEYQEKYCYDYGLVAAQKKEIKKAEKYAAVMADEFETQVKRVPEMIKKHYFELIDSYNLSMHQYSKERIKGFERYLDFKILLTDENSSSIYKKLNELFKLCYAYYMTEEFLDYDKHERKKAKKALLLCLKKMRKATC